MYKNFNLTDEERKQIMESHKSHGYKKPISEIIRDKEYGVVRGIPDYETETGLPSKEYKDKMMAAKQFQQDFQKEFPDPAKEYKPHWEKDRPLPSEDSEIDSEMRRDAKHGYIYYPAPYDPNSPEEEEPVTTPEVAPKLTKKEELDALEKKIIALRLYNNEFGLDDNMSKLYKELVIKFRDDLRDFNRGGVK